MTLHSTLRNKLRSASKRLNYTKMKDEVFSDEMDQWIRIGCSQFRTLKLSQSDYIRCAKKMSCEEKKAIDEVIALMQVDPCLYSSLTFHLYCWPNISNKNCRE